MSYENNMNCIFIRQIKKEKFHSIIIIIFIYAHVNLLMKTKNFFRISQVAEWTFQKHSSNGKLTLLARQGLYTICSKKQFINTIIDIGF